MSMSLATTPARPQTETATAAAEIATGAEAVRVSVTQQAFLRAHATLRASPIVRSRTGGVVGPVAWLIVSDIDPPRLRPHIRCEERPVPSESQIS